MKKFMNDGFVRATRHGDPFGIANRIFPFGYENTMPLPDPDDLIRGDELSALATLYWISPGVEMSLLAAFQNAYQHTTTPINRQLWDLATTRHALRLQLREPRRACQPPGAEDLLRC